MVTATPTRPGVRPPSDRSRILPLRHAPFALRIVRRSGGDAAIVYRRRVGQPSGNEVRAGAKLKAPDRLRAIGSMGPLAFAAATPLLRAGVRAAGPAETRIRLEPGPSLPLDHDWGARIACFARVSAGLRDGDRLSRAANALYNASGPEAAWWLGLMERDATSRAVRALRILTEATL